MKRITLELPESMAELYPKVDDRVFLSALRLSLKQLIREEQKKLKTMNKRISIFEKKYKKTFAEFKEDFPLDGDVQLHEDYGEWSYLVNVAGAIEQDIKKYRHLNGIEL